MSYHYRDASGTKTGPTSSDELRPLHLSGTVKPNTHVFEGDAATVVSFREIWPRLGATANPTTSTPPFVRTVPPPPA